MVCYHKNEAGMSLAARHYLKADNPAGERRVKKNEFKHLDAAFYAEAGGALQERVQ